MGIVIFLLLVATAFATKVFIADDPVVLYNAIASYYFNLGNIEKSKSMYERVLEFDPNNVKALHNLGVISYSQKNYGEAEEKFNAAIEANFGYENAYYSLALMLIEQKKDSDAIPLLEKTIALNPGNMNARFDLAVIYVEQFRMKEQAGFLTLDDLSYLRKGLEHYNGVVESNPNFPDAVSNRDIVADVLGSYEAQLQ